MRKLMTGNGNPPPDKPKKDQPRKPGCPVEDGDVSPMDTGNGNPPPDTNPN
jgi:hypothetical protein